MALATPPTEKPPRASFGVYKRMLLGGLLIVLFTAGAVSTAALLKVKDIVNDISIAPPAKFHRNTITKAEAGQPQTILLIGSDKRYGSGKGDARSDTLMLLRLDPDNKATAVMSIPRDLEVTIPGHGTDKINAAFSFGGPDLTTRTIKSLLHVNINHVISLNFDGFQRVVDFVGCVYVDVDRRYYHSNVGLPPSAQYSEIDLDPGYQRLCGAQALSYVRFRHADSDLVRAARQQDFLRDAKEQVGTSRLINDLDPLVKIFGEYTSSDSDLHSENGILRLLQLAAFSTGHPIREIHFPADLGGPTAQFVTATPAAIAQVTQQFMRGQASTGQRRTDLGHSTKHHAKKVSKKRQKATPAYYAKAGLVDGTTLAQNLVATTEAKHLVPFTLYYPSVITPVGQYLTGEPASTPDNANPRTYTLKDRAGRLHHAYRITVQQNEGQGQYYGIQGTDWKTPPILLRNYDTMRLGGRTFHLYYDGSLLRVVSWVTPHAVYWVSNTLSLFLTNRQMLGIARSLTHD